MRAQSVFLFAILVFFGGAFSYSQANQAQARQLMKSLVLQPSEMDQIEKVFVADDDSLAKDRAEMQILQARLARLLLEPEPSMEQIKGIIKESLDWELQVRLILIGRQISVRKIVGDERWTTMFRLARAINALERGAPTLEARLIDPKEFPDGDRIVAILKKLI
jgi:hypothetical protein